MKTTIKVDWSASEMNPWTSEIDVVNFNISSGIITCKSNDSRLGKNINIPMDRDFYNKKGMYIIYSGWEMIAWVNFDDVFEIINNKLTKI